MQTIELQQGSPEWLEARKKIIGASDVACILGVSPWKSAYQLWEEKVGEKEKGLDKEKEFLFNKGHQVERKIREIFEEQFGIPLQPAVVRHQELEWCQASLDGFNLEKKFLVEMKYMGRGAWLEMKNNEEVPAHYYAQCQYQMFCTGVESMYLVAMTDEKLAREAVKNKLFSGLAAVEVKFNKEYARKMIKECAKFYECMTNKEPPEFGKMDYVPLENLVAQVVVDDVISLMRQKKEIEQKLNEKRELIRESMTAPRMRTGNALLTISKRKGNIDYGSIPELKEIDLEQFRKPDSEVFKVEEIDD